jgi:hypothetical protein
VNFVGDAPVIKTAGGIPGFGGPPGPGGPGGIGGNNGAGGGKAQDGGQGFNGPTTSKNGQNKGRQGNIIIAPQP